MPDATDKTENTIEEVQKDITKWTSDKADNICATSSCAEYRRRKILKKVLSACGTFQVDILVLPEYSVRPETVEWIAIQLPELAPKVSVWAGTFRKPPYMTGMCADKFKVVPDWAAPLPIVFPSDSLTNKGDIHVIRGKKYPAAGLGEVFNPYMEEIQPISWKLKGLQGYGDHRDLVCELICSKFFYLPARRTFFHLESGCAP
jgi:hypothetical protein